MLLFACLIGWFGFGFIVVFVICFRLVWFAVCCVVGWDCGFVSLGLVLMFVGAAFVFCDAGCFGLFAY